MKDDVITVEGEVVENLPNTLFKVKLLNSEKVILCYLSGKMRKNYIKILPGDKVKIVGALRESDGVTFISLEKPGDIIIPITNGK